MAVCDYLSSFVALAHVVRHNLTVTEMTHTAAVLASTVDFAVDGHGVFTVLPADHAEQMKRTRKDLLQSVVWIYEGTSERGGKPSHWRGYKKSDLAAIVADGTGNFAEAVQAARRADVADTITREATLPDAEVPAVVRYTAMSMAGAFDDHRAACKSLATWLRRFAPNAYRKCWDDDIARVRPTQHAEDVMTAQTRRWFRWAKRFGLAASEFPPAI